MKAKIEMIVEYDYISESYFGQYIKDCLETIGYKVEIVRVGKL